MAAAPGRAVIGGAACLRSQDARHQVEVRRQWAKPDGRVRWRLGKEASDLNRKSREFSPRTSLCAIRVVCLSAVENACSVIRVLAFARGTFPGRSGSALRGIVARLPDGSAAFASRARQAAILTSWARSIKRSTQAVSYQPPLPLTCSAQRSTPVMTGLDPVISIGWLLTGIASFAICYG